MPGGGGGGRPGPGGAFAYAHDVLHIEKLMLRVFAFNKAAIRSYESAGFVKMGDLPAVQCSDGEVSDMILMETIIGV